MEFGHIVASNSEEWMILLTPIEWKRGRKMESFVTMQISVRALFFSATAFYDQDQLENNSIFFWSSIFAQD